MWESHEIFWNIKRSYVPSSTPWPSQFGIQKCQTISTPSSSPFSCIFFFLSSITKMSQEITEFRTLSEMLHMYWLIVLLFQLWMVNTIIIPILQMRRLRLTVVTSTFSKLHSSWEAGLRSELWGADSSFQGLECHEILPLPWENSRPEKERGLPKPIGKKGTRSQTSCSHLGTLHKATCVISMVLYIGSYWPLGFRLWKMFQMSYADIQGLPIKLIMAYWM